MQIYIVSLIVLFALAGCKLSDDAKAKVKEKVEEEIERIKHQYNEYKGEKDDRGERPFEVVYQKDENAKTPIINSSCTTNQVAKHIYFQTQAEASNNIYSKLQNLYSYPSRGILRPVWDVRYTNPINLYINGNNGLKYPNHSKLTGLDARTGIHNTTVGTAYSKTNISGTVAQTKCVNGLIAAGLTLNLFDSPVQAITYAGPQSTFAYHMKLDSDISPWKENQKGNLIMQAYFDMPIYNNFETNIGGSVSFALFLYNKKIKKYLSYIITAYAFGEAWQKEKAGIRFDPTTNIIHVATVVKDSSWWSTISPKSKSIQEIFNTPNKKTKDDGKWNDFYRVNISYQNLLAVLNELKTNPPAEVAGQDFGLNPENWEVKLLAIQYELEEQGGKASLSGSFRGFEAYTSHLPL